ncbi:MAG: hypothetical protein ACP6KW_09135 [Candidatus Thorarchaeota archaeon]
MNNDCPDGTCRLKILEIDRALGHEKNEWAVLLKSSENTEDVNNALRFCEVFHLESKVKVTHEGYTVLFRSDVPNKKPHLGI